jgi:regulator of sigma E protease
MQIIISLILLSFLILIHELGHLWGAKLFKVKVKEFSIFMGPKLFSIKSKKTEYSVRAIPIGGYVAMEGETEKSDDKDALLNKPRWQQAIVMFSGPLMNLIFGLLAFFILTLAAGYMTTDLADIKASVPDINMYIQDEQLRYDTVSPAELAGLQDGDRLLRYNGRTVTYPIDILVYSLETKDKPVKIEYERNGKTYETTLYPVIIPETDLYKIGVYLKTAGTGAGISPEIEQVVAASPAEQAGIAAGDKIVSMNDIVVEDMDDMAAILAKSGGQLVKIKLLRDGKEMDIFLRPEKVTQKQVIYTGLYFQEGQRIFIRECIASVKYCFSVIKSVYYSIIWLISGKVSIKDAMGPVGIISTIGNVVSSKDSFRNIMEQLLSLMALISINLGFVNLIPFPALDGSKLVIIGIESATRKKIPIEKQAVISFVGFVVLIILLIAITGIDIMRLIGK